MAPDVLMAPTSWSAANQSLPSGPETIESVPPTIGMVNWVTRPFSVIRPIFGPASSVNQRLPSGPAVIALSLAQGPGTRNWVIWPAVVIRPIQFAPCWVNQRLPSGPAAMALG